MSSLQALKQCSSSKRRVQFVCECQGDDSGEPEVRFNPGRLRLPAWAFREAPAAQPSQPRRFHAVSYFCKVALLRQEILRLREEEG